MFVQDRGLLGVARPQALRYTRPPRTKGAAVNIVILDGYAVNPGDNPWDEVAKLGELSVYDRTPDDKIIERAREADIILTDKTPLRAETFPKLAKLRFVAVLATGYDPVAAARGRGIPVSNVPGYGTGAVAEHVFALLLELCRHVGLHDDAVKAGDWSRAPDYCFWRTPQLELAGRTMGIIGLGRIGRRVAALAGAFGMPVIANDRSQGERPRIDQFAWAGARDLFAQADVVTMHCPLTGETRGMVNADLLGRMKPGAFFINTSRGGLVVEQDLADALNAGRIAGAACDVVAKEPITADSPLLSANNCILTPHIAWAALEARQRLVAATAANVGAFIAGAPTNVVN